jgi:FkbM family methyltransferase
MPVKHSSAKPSRTGAAPLTRVRRQQQRHDAFYPKEQDMADMIDYHSARAPGLKMSVQDLKRYLKQFPALVAAKRAIESLPSTTMRSIGRLPIFRSKLFRKMSLDFAAPDSLVVSAGAGEKFIIVAADKIIGRVTYVDQAPYGFDRMEKLLRLLGEERPRTLLIDIGANIGTISIPAVKRGLFKSAIAIEPEPRNYSLLSANIHLNGVSDKIVAHNLALGQTDDAEILFEIAKGNLGDHRIHVASDVNLCDEGNREIIRVKSRTFDKLIQNIDPRGTLIWIDTQGFEGYILSGATAALRTQPPLCIEFWPYGMERSGSYPLLKQAIVEAGYNFFHDLDHETPALPLTNQALDGLYAKLDANGEATDLLLLRRE